jgi:hypothetical protein
LRRIDLGGSSSSTRYIAALVSNRGPDTGVQITRTRRNRRRLRRSRTDCMLRALRTEWTAPGFLQPRSSSSPDLSPLSLPSFTSPRLSGTRWGSLGRTPTTGKSRVLSAFRSREASSADAPPFYSVFKGTSRWWQQLAWVSRSGNPFSYPRADSLTSQCSTACVISPLLIPDFFSQLTFFTRTFLFSSFLDSDSTMRVCLTLCRVA